MWWNGAATELVEAWFGMMRTGIAAVETAVAAGTVINHRSALIVDAIQRPWAADHAELGRMVPEKVRAFSQSGTNIMQAMVDGHRDLERYVNRVGSLARQMAVSGPLAQPDSMARMIDGAMAHGARQATRSMAAVDAALAPIHKRAVANAKRLSRA